jgi:hypothetical protein
MIANTLTVIEELQPGDVFCKESGEMKFIKVPGNPIKICKEVFPCFAIPLQSIEPKRFKGNTPVIFLYNDPHLLTQKTKT